MATNSRKLFRFIGAASGLMLITLGAQAQLITADIGVIMDESGSMGGEQAFIGGAMGDLDAGLIAAGITGNRFGLVGYGASDPDPIGIDETGRGDELGSKANFMNSSDFNTATSFLQTGGGLEDGFDGIDFFFNNYSLRSGAATNIILVTDEDRDTRDSAISKSDIESLLSGNSALLNVIVNASFECEDGATALGLDNNSTGFVADGSGGFTTCSGATTTTAFGTTETDYVDLALGSGGAAWDLNQLRAGGNDAASFSAAFLDIKVREIEEQDPTEVPAPSPLALFGLGLLVMGGLRRWHP